MLVSTPAFGGVASIERLRQVMVMLPLFFAQPVKRLPHLRPALLRDSIPRQANRFLPLQMADSLVQPMFSVSIAMTATCGDGGWAGGLGLSYRTRPLQGRAGPKF